MEQQGTQGQGTSDDPKAVTYYVFSLLKEPDDYVADHLLCINGGRFGIHGLWPNYTKDSYPVFCDKTAQFDEAALAPIKAQLEKYWHSDSRPDAEFWEHEWLKHGTCTNPMLKEYDYFKKVLELYDQVKSDTFRAKVNLADYLDDTECKCELPFNLNFVFDPGAVPDT